VASSRLRHRSIVRLRNLLGRAPRRTRGTLEKVPTQAGPSAFLAATMAGIALLRSAPKPLGPRGPGGRPSCPRVAQPRSRAWFAGAASQRCQVETGVGGHPKQEHAANPARWVRQTKAVRFAARMPLHNVDWATQCLGNGLCLVLKYRRFFCDGNSVPQPVNSKHERPRRFREDSNIRRRAASSKTIPNTRGRVVMPPPSTSTSSCYFACLCRPARLACPPRRRVGKFWQFAMRACHKRCDCRAIQGSLGHRSVAREAGLNCQRTITQFMTVRSGWSSA
jgi:hypothetical protein